MLILTDDELKALAGKKSPKAITKWLFELGVNFLPGADGFPRVSRELINKKLNGESELTPINNKKGNEDALRKVMRK